VTNDAPLDWSPVWSPDGKWLYFGSDRDGTMNLWRVAIDEGSGKVRSAPEPLSLPATWAGHFSISRGGDIVYVERTINGTAYRVPFDPASGRATGEPQRIRSGSLIPFSAPAFSPDDQWITFSNDGRQEDLYLQRADGGDLRQLTNDPEKDRGPAFSADGKEIYFYSQRGPRYEVWSIRPDGSGLRQVSTTTGRALWYPKPLPGRDALYAVNDTGTFILPFNADRTITRVEPLPPLPDPAAYFFARDVTADGTKLIGEVARPPLTGIWTYTFATKRYERVSTDAPRNDQLFWVGGSPNLAAALIGQKVTLYDTATKQKKELALPLREIEGVIASHDGRTLVVDEGNEGTMVWRSSGQ
jgi:WD40 repeat protein